MIGPTGVALSKNGDTLYVADTLNNRVAAIDDPLTRHSSGGTGTTLTTGGTLNFPLASTPEGFACAGAWASAGSPSTGAQWPM